MKLDKKILGNKRKEYLSWDEFFIGIAKLSAGRSKDPSTQVGACIVSEENRILSVTYDEFAPAEQPRVADLPEGDVADYLYVDGEYIYSPLPIIIDNSILKNRLLYIFLLYLL